MQTGWRVGSLFNIPLFIDPSWFFVLAFIALTNGLAWYETYPSWGILPTWGAGLAMALLLFGSVLLHELGHSLVARSQGIKVNSITLFLFGGMASIDQESKTPGQAFQVAIAGPLVSLTLFGLLSLLATILPTDNIVGLLAADLAKINLILTLFNLIPGLPLDGGQIFKAAVWKATGDRFKAVHWAARGGQILGWLAILLGGSIVLLAGNYSGLWIGLLGWFAVRNASAYNRVTDWQEALVQLKASDALSREFRVIDANMTLRQFADEYLLGADHPPVYFAASEGRYRGLVSADDLRLVERSQWEVQTLQQIVHPLTEIPTIYEKTPLTEVINRMEEQQLRRITVLTPADAVAGVIDPGDIVQAIAHKLNLQISAEVIKRIKEEGSYPPGLQLPALAKLAANSTDAS
ncbi:MAG: site-2 protease family protein [Leptolyngbyaceae bacterium]|nr:site-2 protease family protein [Leptolyngbyaceae bacterium]